MGRAPIPVSLLAKTVNWDPTRVVKEMMGKYDMMDADRTENPCCRWFSLIVCYGFLAAALYGLWAVLPWIAGGTPQIIGTTGIGLISTVPFLAGDNATKVAGE